MKQARMLQAVPEIPVTDLSSALDYYKKTLYFKVAWIDQTQQLSAVIFDNALLYLRQKQVPFEKQVCWIATDDVDASYKRFEQLGATLLNTPQDMPWQHRQFSFEDQDGNLFHIHQKITAKLNLDD